MKVTPAFYPHLIFPLMGLAKGKVAVFVQVSHILDSENWKKKTFFSFFAIFKSILVLQGGNCMKSLAEGAALTLRTLLGDPCPTIESLPDPCQR